MRSQSLRAEDVLCYLRSSDSDSDSDSALMGSEPQTTRNTRGPLLLCLPLTSSEANMEKQTDGIDRTVY